MLSLEGQETGWGMLEGQLEQLEQLLTVASPGAGQHDVVTFPCLQGHAYVADEAEGDGETVAEGDEHLDCQEEGGRGQGQRERH